MANTLSRRWLRVRKMRRQHGDQTRARHARLLAITRRAQRAWKARP